MSAIDNFDIALERPFYSVLFNKFARGITTRAILRTNPHIRAETIAAARAVLAMTQPKEYARVAALPPRPRYKILLDENITRKAALVLPKDIYDITTVNGAGLNGTKDPELWPIAVHEHFDAIITCDKTTRNPEKDLTRIAMDNALEIVKREHALGQKRVNLNELPLIIHLRCEQNKAATIAAIFNQHASQIRHFIETTTVPYVMVTPEKLIPAKTFNQLIHDEITRHIHPKIPREERCKEIWRNKARRYHIGPVSDEDNLELEKTIQKALPMYLAAKANLVSSDVLRLSA